MGFMVMGRRGLLNRVLEESILNSTTEFEVCKHPLSPSEIHAEMSL